VRTIQRGSRNHTDTAQAVCQLNIACIPQVGSMHHLQIMAASERPKTVLFVDDEPSIRLTLAAILRQSGFEVSVAATVDEALREINTQYFDALISDLNIGEPGDGFTVLSAMRRVQPTCINLILTGYPAWLMISDCSIRRSTRRSRLPW